MEQLIGGAGGAYQGDPLWQAALRLVLALAVLLPLVYAVTRLYARAGTGAAGRGALRVVDAVAIGQNRSICLVEVGERLLVVGSTPQSISLLAEFRDGGEVLRIKERLGAGAARPFASLLRERLGRPDPSGQSGVGDARGEGPR